MVAEFDGDPVCCPSPVGLSGRVIVWPIALRSTVTDGFGRRGRGFSGLIIPTLGFSSWRLSLPRAGGDGMTVIELFELPPLEFVPLDAPP
jgi:hypothetical protein